MTHRDVPLSDGAPVSGMATESGVAPGRALHHRVLVLGGTAEARELAEQLERDGRWAYVSSLAGRVSRPRLPVGETRIGGFGGVEGLRAFLEAGEFTAVVDATHPFATQMRANAVSATSALGLPMIRLARPGWAVHPDASLWTWVDDYDAARRAVEALGGLRPFLTSGRQTLPHFLRWSERDVPVREVLVRVVEPLDISVPPSWTVLLDRGPFGVDEERRIMRDHGVDALVTKDSGGSYTAAKLTAARELAIPVVVVRRPAPPAGLVEVADVADVMTRLSELASAPR